MLRRNESTSEVKTQVKMKSQGIEKDIYLKTQV